MHTVQNVYEYTIIHVTSKRTSQAEMDYLGTGSDVRTTVEFTIGRILTIRILLALVL